MNPDLGQFLWERGWRDNISIIGKFAAVHDCGDAREASGVLVADLGGGSRRYCMTVRTKQSLAALKRIIVHRGNIVLANGKLDSREVCGDSGEVYRMIIGRIEGTRA